MMKRFAIILWVFTLLLGKDSGIERRVAVTVKKGIPVNLEKIGDYPFPTNPIRDPELLGSFVSLALMKMLSVVSLIPHW